MTTEFSQARGREVVTNRAGGRCEGCGHTQNLEHAHRKARSQGGGWEPSNALRLCRICHAYSHSHPEWSRRVGWMVPRDGDPATTPTRVLMWGLMPVIVHLDDEGQYHPIDTYERPDQ